MIKKGSLDRANLIRGKSRDTNGEAVAEQGSSHSQILRSVVRILDLNVQSRSCVKDVIVPDDPIMQV